MIQEKLIAIQQDLNVPKGNYNSFGGYKYRSCEDILEAVKPLLKKNKVALTLSDDMVCIGDRFYIKATATLSDGEEQVSTTAFARESLDKKGMDSSQITGACSSYARKYALNGLFCIDDVKDADTMDNRSKEEKATPRQVKYLEKLYTGENLTKLLESYNIKELKEMSKESASKLIDKINNGGR